MSGWVQRETPNGHREHLPLITIRSALITAKAFQHDADLLVGLLRTFRTVRSCARLSHRCSSGLTYAINPFCPTSADSLGNRACSASLVPARKKSKARISSRACSRITLVVIANPSRGHASDARTRKVLGDIASSRSAGRHNRSSPCSSGVPCMRGDRYQLQNRGPEGKLLAPLQPSHRSRQSRRRCRPRQLVCSEFS